LKIKNLLESEIKTLKVTKNLNIERPELGAFEVYYGDFLLFSKISS